MKRDPSPTNVEKYCKLSNVVHSRTRRDTKEKAVLLSQSSSFHHKWFWAWVNSVKRHQTPLPQLLDSSSEVIFDNTSKAELFNHYFFSVLPRKIVPI